MTLARKDLVLLLEAHEARAGGDSSNAASPITIGAASRRTKRAVSTVGACTGELHILIIKTTAVVTASAVSLILEANQVAEESGL